MDLTMGSYLSRDSYMETHKKIVGDDKIKKYYNKKIDWLAKKNTSGKSLTIINTSSDKASEIYAKHKIADCEKVGIAAKLVRLKINKNEDYLKFLVDLATLYSNDDGIIVQSPIEIGIEASLFDVIPPTKDVDGLCEKNQHKLYSNSKGYFHIPATARGIFEYLIEQKIDIKNGQIAIVGRSQLVGKPLARLLENNGATVCVCHSKTPPTVLKQVVENATIVIVATGKMGVVDHLDLTNAKIVFDVGIHRINGKLRGDICPMKDGNITPVPNGVGLLTRIALIKNILKIPLIYGGAN